jgi:Na+-translocating ferredoxin:NAD+ oxidoreductase RnfD subunit
VTAPSRTLRIRGTDYPLLLPTLRDPRLHLAAIIVSLQILGQVAFEFRLSIAQILISLLTCAVLEVVITFRWQHVIMWPASALLTGNGVAFILRVPGTEHGDWWSLNGWWIFAGAAAFALLSKYVIRWRGHHVFNPSNIGLVVCFLVLGPARAEPLDFWWGPMSPWLALALALIVVGGFAILRRLHLLGIAIGFWLVFASGIALLAATDHAMTARWHLGPIIGAELWRVLVFSPEILVFLFFMITDPKTVPEEARARRVFGVAIGLVSVLLIAPQTTEWATKVAVLASLALVCAARPLLDVLRSARRTAPIVERARLQIGAAGRPIVGALLLSGALAAAVLVIAVSLAAAPSVVAAEAPGSATGEVPETLILPSEGVATRLDSGTAREIVSVALAKLGVPGSEVDRASVTLEPGAGQGPPIAVVTLIGVQPLAFERTFELTTADGRFTVVRERDPAAQPPAPAEGIGVFAAATGDVAPGLRDVAQEVGLRFRQGSFRYSADSSDNVSMMGGGVCWLDFDRDGWLDLFVVNSYSEHDVARWRAQGNLPRSALFHNEGGRFVDVSRSSGANLALRGNGCVAADFDLDGRIDVYVTTNTYDALLWNRGGGSFTEGARAAGIDHYGWHTGAAVGDVNGDGLPDLFVAGYTDPNAPIPDSFEGFPQNHRGVRDLLYLNQGRDGHGRTTFREVGELAGVDAGEPDHGLGAVLSDLDGDGRLDVYVANDLDPNQLYRNVRWPGGATADPLGLGFRLRDVAAQEGVADPNAGMGIAVADYDGNGLSDVFVSNARGQDHAVYRARRAVGGPAFAEASADFASAFGNSFTGWGASWVDLDLDTDLDFVLVNGDIPVASLAEDAEPIQVLENVAASGTPPRFADVGARADTSGTMRINGRGLAAADYDNDGDVDIAINTIGGALVLLENSAAHGNWLEIELDGFSLGARVKAVLPDGRSLVREVRAGGSYLSSEDPRIHFGLGAATEVRALVIRYPNGSRIRLADIAANRVVTPPAVGP